MTSLCEVGLVRWIFGEVWDGENVYIAASGVGVQDINSFSV